MDWETVESRYTVLVDGIVCLENLVLPPWLDMQKS